MRRDVSKTRHRKARATRPTGGRRSLVATNPLGVDGVDDQAAFLEAYRAACARHLPDGEIDYVRLRWRAVRRDDRSR